MATVDQIMTAVRQRIEANAAGLFPRKYQNKDLQNPPEHWAEVIISPDDSTVIGPNGETLRGQILINIHVQQNDGATMPAREGEKFRALFPRGLEFDGVSIGRSRIGNQFDGRGDRDKLNITPVVINYTSEQC